jgi:predicted dienelactone hydrolase
MSSKLRLASAVRHWVLAVGMLSVTWCGNALAVIAEPPSLVGPYPVACSNVEQDFTRLRSGESGPDYWEGNPLVDGSKYVTDLLLSPANALTYPVSVPTREQIDVFERQGGKQLQYAAYACYPTTAANTRANYVLPSGATLPRMQRGAEAPIFAANVAAADGKWPLIVMSHGLAGSPLGDEYVQVIVRLAAEGYVVFAPFHADARYSRVKLEDISDYFYVISKYAEIAEMQAIRPLGLKQGLDYILSKPEYAAAIDSDRIAGFGASLGGMAMMLAQGSKMTTSLGGAERVIVRDNRYKALVGYVPFSGYSFQPAFGDSNQGVNSVRVPYLGIGGTADVVAPISRTSQMIGTLGGSKYFVTIEGMPHGLRAQDAPELFGWTFAFLKAHLSRNQSERVALDQITNFAGNADDRLQIHKTLGWGSRDELEVVEYQSLINGNYFITGTANDIVLLDQYPQLWQRTGRRFAMLRTDTEVPSNRVCRFYMTVPPKVSSHFFSQYESDCAVVRQQPWAIDEGYPMRAWQFVGNPPEAYPVNATCPADTVKLVRLYDSVKVNHRYLTEPELARTTLLAGTIVEGPAFCGAKYGD